MAQTAIRISLITLAIAEMIFFAIAIGTVGYFIDGMGNTADKSSGSRQLLVDMGTYGRHEFFLSAAAIGFFTAIVSLVIAIANRQEKTHWAVNMVTLHAFCALILLVSASLLAKTSQTYGSETTRMCKDLKTASSNARCYQQIIGLVLGFVSVALFIGDIIIYFFILTQNAGSSFMNMANLSS